MQSHAAQCGSRIERHFETIEHGLGTGSVITNRQDIATGCERFFSSLDDAADSRCACHRQIIGEYDTAKIEIAAKYPANPASRRACGYIVDIGIQHMRHHDPGEAISDEYTVRRDILIEIDEFASINWQGMV